MRLRLAAALLFGSFFLAGSAFAQAGDPEASPIHQGAVAAGINYPGLGLRYFMTDLYMAEARAQTTGNVTLGGARLCRYFEPLSKVYPYVGLEADYLSFRGAAGRGTGYSQELFAGGEYFVSREFSVSMDVGPAYLELSDQNSSASVSGLQFVANFGINYYFGR